MKRVSFLLLIVLVLSLTVLVSACSSTDADTDSVPETAATPSVSQEADETTAPEAEPAETAAAETDPAETAEESQAPQSPLAEPFVFEEQTYTNENITIRFPQIVGLTDSTVQDALNKLLSDTAFMNLSELESGTEYELGYTVSMNTPDVISVWFDGYYNVPGAAHPGLLLFAVTIDVASEQAVALSYLVTIDSDFIALLRSGEYISSNYDMTDEIRAAIEENLNDDEILINELSQSGTSIWSSAYYLTESGLVLSVSVPHVLGDHVEISIAYDELAPFKTDNALWNAVG